MTEQQQLMRDLWLQELWRPVPELSREERDVKRALDEAARTWPGDAQPVEPISTNPQG